MLHVYHPGIGISFKIAVVLYGLVEYQFLAIILMNISKCCEDST